MSSSDIGAAKPLQPSRIFYFTEIIGAKIIHNGGQIGKLADLMIIAKGMPLPHITHLYITRPSGNAVLIVPIEKILDLNEKIITIDPESVSRYENVPDKTAMSVKSHVLNQQVIDMGKRRVATVCDVKILRVNKNMYVTDVDFSKYGRFRQFGLKRLADMLMIKEEIVSWTDIQLLPSPCDTGGENVKFDAFNEKLNEMPSADLADILEELHHGQRLLFFNTLDAEAAAKAFVELSPSVRREMFASLGTDTLARLLNAMTPGQAADALDAVSDDEKNALLQRVKPELHEKVEAVLGRQEQNILDYCISSVLKFSPQRSIGEIRNNFAALARDKEAIMYLYVVDANDHVQGVLDLKELLMADDKAKLCDVMNAALVGLTPENTLRDAYEMFNRYGFMALPVLDADNKIIGVLRYKDVTKLERRFLD